MHDQGDGVIDERHYDEAHRRERWLRRARERVARLEATDLFAFMTVREIAGRAATARFYDAFPAAKAKDARGGRDLLIEYLMSDVTHHHDGDINTETLNQLMELMRALTARDPVAVQQLKEVSADDFRRYRADTASETIRFMLGTAADSDDDAKSRMASYYEKITASYTAHYTVLLKATGREPIRQIGSVENFARILTALFDGLLYRARFDSDVDGLLVNALIPVIAALTKPEEAADLTDEERLFPAPSSSAGPEESSLPGVQPKRAAST